MDCGTRIYAYLYSIHIHTATCILKAWVLWQVGPQMLKDLDVHWVILGHSERRHVIGESDAHVGDKIKQALATGLKVIACIGETESQRDAGEVSINLFFEPVQTCMACEGATSDMDGLRARALVSTPGQSRSQVSCRPDRTLYFLTLSRSMVKVNPRGI